MSRNIFKNDHLFGHPVLYLITSKFKNSIPLFFIWWGFGLAQSGSVSFPQVLRRWVISEVTTFNKPEPQHPKKTFNKHLYWIIFSTFECQILWSLSSKQISNVNIPIGMKELNKTDKCYFQKLSYKVSQKWEIGVFLERDWFFLVCISALVLRTYTLHQILVEIHLHLLPA